MCRLPSAIFAHERSICMYAIFANIQIYKLSPLGVSLGCQGTPQAHRPRWPRQTRHSPGQIIPLPETKSALKLSFDKFVRIDTNF